MLIDFWATWCGPCGVEIPTLEKISKQFAKNDMVVLGINAEEPDGVVRKFAANHNITYPVVLTKDNAAVLQSYRIRAFPRWRSLTRTASSRLTSSERTSRRNTMHDVVKHVLSTKYTAPVPKILEVAQTNPNKAKPPDNYGWGVDPNWKAKTADEFLARAYVMAMSTKFAESHFDMERP